MADAVGQFLDIIDNRIEKHLNDNAYGYVRQRGAIVTEYDDESKKAFVYFVDDEKQTQYTFYNKTNELLSSGDNVKVYYVTNPAKGWIGARCGEPNIKEFENAGNDISHLFEYEYLTDLSVKFNGTTYTVEKDSTTGLISKISDSSGNSFEPTINSEITDAALHNAVFWAVAMCRGLSTPKIMPIRSGLVGYFDYKQRCRSSLWENILGTENIPITGSAAVSVDCLEMPNQTYGMFKMPYEGNGDLTLYVVAKTSVGTSTAAHDCVVGSSYSNAPGNWRALSSDGYTADGDAYQAWWCDVFGSGVGGSVDGTYFKTYSRYHIVTLVQNNGVLRMYMDGKACDSSQTISARYGDYWGINCLADNNGGIQNFNGVKYSNLTSYIKMFAIGRTPHTAEQIATNVAWLKKYYEF